MAPLMLSGAAGEANEARLWQRLAEAEVGGTMHSLLATAMVWRLVFKVLRTNAGGELNDLATFLSVLRDSSPSKTSQLLNTFQADGKFLDWNRSGGLGVLFSDDYMATPLGLAVVAGLGDLDMLNEGEEPEDYTKDTQYFTILRLICVLKEHGADDAAMAMTLSSHGDWEPYAASDFIRDMLPSRVWIAVALAAVTG